MPDFQELPSIDLGLAKKLKDKNYRQSFFLAESSALIAKQLIALRKRRGLNQTQVADIAGTGQPAISRVERADYRNWSFNTLRKLAEAMDARIRVYIEPSEDVLSEYEQDQASIEISVKVPAAAESASSPLTTDVAQFSDRKTIQLAINVGAH
jgi:transcriptional regulator with XRE-family HTH domain